MTRLSAVDKQMLKLTIACTFHRSRSAIVPGPDGETSAVDISRLDKEQRAWLVEHVLETKDQDVRRLLEKIRDRKRR